VSVTGSGNEVARFVIDGVDAASHKIASTLTGTHSVDIVMSPCTP